MAYFFTDKEDAAFAIATYREDHKIVPVTQFDHNGSYCAHDGLPLDPRKGGWTHSQGAILRASDAAGYVPVGRCRHRYIPGGVPCNMTLGRHLREKRLRVYAAEAGRTLPPLHDFTE